MTTSRGARKVWAKNVCAQLDLVRHARVFVLVPFEAVTQCSIAIHRVHAWAAEQLVSG